MNRMVTLAPAVVSVCVLIGCGGSDEVVIPENPVPPPPADSLKQSDESMSPERLTAPPTDD